VDIPKIARLIWTKKLDLHGLVTDEYPLDEINEALAVMMTGETGRVLLRMDS
jgi:S-(hydroxymethyl)glutathione dehydrogenase/alcohol dehydrogenase